MKWRFSGCFAIRLIFHAPVVTISRFFPPQALIDGPYTETGVSRQVINFKRLSLTDYKLAIGVNAGHKALTAAWKKAGVQEKWNASSWGRRVAGKQAKAEQSDFDRFTAQVTKQKVRAGGFEAPFCWNSA